MSTTRIPEILPYGDHALLVRFEQTIDTDIHQNVIALEKAIVRAAIPGYRYSIPAYCSLTVVFEPLSTSYDAWKSILNELLQQGPPPEVRAESRTLTIPVCYEAPFAPDMQEVQDLTGLTAESIIALHTQHQFRVYMLGFLPGFAYMGKTPEALFCPRKSVPRTQVPAGSVGLAGFQTGIYPSPAPGGWQLIGQTPISVFNPERTAPFLFQPGDLVQFKAITEAEFWDLKAGEQYRTSPTI